MSCVSVVAEEGLRTKTSYMYVFVNIEVFIISLFLSLLDHLFEFMPL